MALAYYSGNQRRWAKGGLAKTLKDCVAYLCCVCLSDELLQHLLVVHNLLILIKLLMMLVPASAAVAQPMYTHEPWVFP